LTTKGVETVLYPFCSQTNCTDGVYPQASLIADKSGNLYGTTESGGANCLDYCGAVFEVTQGGAETVLYSFCVDTSCTDGAEPVAGLVRDRLGNLFGTTQSGSSGNEGVVFKLAPNGSETVLNSLYSSEDHYAQHSEAGLINVNGYLYGTAAYGGTGHGGIVFKLGTLGGDA